MKQRRGRGAWINRGDRERRVSEIAVETEQPKTLEELQKELAEWMTKNGLRPVVFARGLRTGSLANIDDFLPPTHEAAFTLQKVQQ